MSRPGLKKSERRLVAILQRRASYLKQRGEQYIGNDANRDKAEYAALVWALRMILTDREIAPQVCCPNCNTSDLTWLKCLKCFGLIEIECTLCLGMGGKWKCSGCKNQFDDPSGFPIIGVNELLAPTHDAPKNPSALLQGASPQTVIIVPLSQTEGSVRETPSPG